MKTRIVVAALVISGAQELASCSRQQAQHSQHRSEAVGTTGIERQLNRLTLTTRGSRKAPRRPATSVR
jgi:hypothetical protein